MENERDISPLKDWVPTEVHDWEGKERDVLVLNYTLTCPLACNFCCYSCHPKRTEKMPIDLAKRLIREAAQLKSFSSVGFTGGEPFVHYQDLLELGDLLKSVNLPFTIATAGHWATSQDESDDKIKALQERGLIRLNVSHDPSHAKFVPSINIIQAAKSGSRYKIPTYIVGTFFSKEETLEKMLPEIDNLDSISFVNKYVAKVGRAKKRKITQSTYGMNLELENLCCYRRINHDIVVFFDGETYPCCSTFNRATKGISLGNANHISLKQLWEKAEGSLSLRIMKRQGFAKLYEIIKSYSINLYMQLPGADETLGPCSLCNKIFGNPELSQKVKSVFARYEADKIDHLLNYMVKNVGEKETFELVKNLKLL